MKLFSLRFFKELETLFVISSVEIETIFFTFNVIFSINAWKVAVTAFCSSANAVRFEAPFSNFLVRAFNMDASFGKNIFKKVKI